MNKDPIKSLVAIPTYNESKNVVALAEGLLALGLPFDILFIDDSSPDGTGQLIDELCAKYTNIKALHRPGKQGIGSAHYSAIIWAYERGYDVLVTMDCDFTHPPESIAKIFSERSPDSDVVIGSRYLGANSLPGWALWRRFLTYIGHGLTRFLLGIPFDATGALRLYELNRIPKGVFALVHSQGYSFFFESLFVLNRNGFRIHEFPIALPARTYGESKMSLNEMLNSVKLLVRTFFISLFSAEKFQYIAPIEISQVDSSLVDPQGWDYYWQPSKPATGLLYDAVASFYRHFIISPSLEQFVRRYFVLHSRVLHAGCGGGQVDTGVRKLVNVTALDISVNALDFYRKTHGAEANILHGSIFKIPLPDASVDGIYNLGVMEHFSETDIQLILSEFRRVVRPGGRMLLFWPPGYGLSVMFFKVLKKIYALLGKRDAKFHPDEITRLNSAAHARQLVTNAQLSLVEYSFGFRDFFTYAVLVIERPSD